MKKVCILLGLITCLIMPRVAKAADEGVPNPFKELVSWTFEQNVGVTYLYDLDKEQNMIGAKWSLLTSKHEWLYAGLAASQEPALGGHIGFNLGKLVEKIKGEPLVYLKHLEVGYFGLFEFNDGEYRDGVYVNVIKIEF